MDSKTGCSSPGELEITWSTSEVAVYCSSDSERCSRASARCARASASSRVRASSCFFNSISELGPLLTRALPFVSVERSLRLRVGLFAPLRDKVTSSAQSLIPLPVGPARTILTEPQHELAPFHTRSPRRRDSRNETLWNVVLSAGHSGLMLAARITLPHFSIS